MKKIYLILILIPFLIGCESKYYKNEEIINNNSTQEENISNIPEYIDNNPVSVGLYIKGKLITEMDSYFYDNYDISSFDIFLTNEEDIGTYTTSQFKSKFMDIYNSYNNISNLKIGFYYTFETTDGTIENTVIDPSNSLDTFPYLGIYIYDDIHQEDSSWYSHLEIDDMNEDTIFSSVKLYILASAKNIISPIKFTVFTYDDMEDFDENGYYRGNSKHEIIINKNNA